MSLIEMWPALRHAHMTLAACSGALFATRGAAVLLQRPWPMRRHWRVASYVIDTLLLAAGVTLWATLRLSPVRDAWLGTKLLVLVAYILAGSVALKRGKTLTARGAAYGTALALYLFIASVAITHSPAGVFSYLWAR
ncbi:SirB2 family protein [Paraburkholderia kururiensis]|uniref:SirB2 family protein n=1 Tax=Paraburkholderia kururiensis TaxID=984307 RepID=UPI0005A966D8|nr:SirB2 family protein [Paraburkholderia kururiensis]